MNLFEMWYFQIVLPHIQENRTPGSPVILVGGNLASHFSPAVIKSCQDNDIYMTPFPANANHLMQPLDVAVFGPMKKCWRKILEEWRKESRYPGNLPKDQFPTLLSRLWTGISATITQNLISGFRATGLHPPNPQEVLKRSPDGLPENQEGIGRLLDASLIDLLKEHRGISPGEKQKRKRGEKLPPGVNLAGQTCDLTEDTAPIELEVLEGERAGPSTSTAEVDELIMLVPQDRSEDTPGPSNTTRSTNLKKTSNSRPKILPQRKSKRKKDDSSDKCGICLCNWKDYNQKQDWIECVQCKKWICGNCGE